MRIRFLGAAGEVTGSCFLVDTGEIRFLIDCGMFQGGRTAEAKNRKFAFAPPMALAATRITLRHAQLPAPERVRFVEDLAESALAHAARREDH